MDYLPLFGFLSFLLGFIVFFQHCHKETLQHEIEQLKKEKHNEEKKNKLLSKLNDDLLKELHQQSPIETNYSETNI